MPSGETSVYYVLEFPSVSERQRFTESVKITRFTQLKAIQSNLNLSSYLVKQCMDKKHGPQTSHLYIDRVSFAETGTPAKVINDGTLFQSKKGEDFCLSFD